MTFSFKRIISFLISTVLLLSALSLYPTVSYAESLSVGSDEELKAALRNTSASTITITADINVTVTEYEEYHYIVNARHNLELNGYSVKVTNTSNLSGNCDDSTLFRLPIGGGLVISDSSEHKSGSISYHGGIHSFSEDVSYKPLNKITSRNLFYIEEGASVKVLGGSFYAGNSEEQWLHRALEVKNGSFDYYTGKCLNIVYGTVFTVNKNSSLEINAGTFIANGSSRENTLPNRKGWDEKKPASVCIRSFEKSNVTVNDGKFIGANGADVFDFNPSSTVHVLAGSFNNTPALNERISDYDGFAAVVSGEHYGRVNLPVGAVYAENRTKFIQNGAFLPELPGNSFLRESNGDEIVLSPSEGHPTWIKAVNFSSSYTPGASGSLNSNYDPYFSSGSTITYKWYYSDVNGNTKEIPDSNSKTLDLSKMSSKGCSLSIGSFYSFRCIIIEKYVGNNSYTITTASHNYDLNTSNKYIIAGISLSSSNVDSDERYKPGTLPTLTPASNSQFSISSINFYPINSSDSVSSLDENSAYFVTISITAKGSYRFTQDSRISYVPGLNGSRLAPATDGKSAVISGYVNTYCSHSSITTFENDTQHSKICNTCGTITEIKDHTYPDWPSTQSLERTCTGCSHKQTAPGMISVDNDVTTVHSLIFNFGIPTATKAPSAPKLLEIPGYENVKIDSYTWNDENGADVSKFEDGKTYILTVNLSISEESNAIFSSDTVNVSSLIGISGQGVVSIESKQVVATFSVTPYSYKSASITLPTVNAGLSILETKPVVSLENYNVIWKMNGSKIGSYEVTSGTVSSVTDLNTSDNVSFEEQLFVPGNFYELEVYWDARSENAVLDSGNLTFVSNYAPYSSAHIGTKGIATGAFYLAETDKIIRTPGVTSVVAPVVGKSPSTTVSSVYATNSGYSISSISWNKSGASFTKFSCGGKYTVKVTLTANEGYSFAPVQGSINGVKADLTNSGNTLVLAYTFPALTHNVQFSKASVKLPDCNNTGSVVAKCSQCSQTSSINIQAVGHVFNAVSPIEPTCSHEGIAPHSICYYCLETASVDSNNDYSLPTDPNAHSSLTTTVHDGNYHYDICLDCGTELSEKAEHSYGEYITIEDGYTYHECECGHSVSKDGPKTPNVPVGNDEVIIDPGNESPSLGKFPIEKIKMLLLIMLIFAILLIGSIIVISIILIVTREKTIPVPAGVSETPCDVPAESVQTDDVTKEESTTTTK